MAGLVLIPFAALRIFWKSEKQHLLPVVWASLVILLFSAVQTKIHWYIIPVYPALALLTGWALEKILKKYTIPVAIVLSVFSLVYLSVDKDIFNMDCSPNIKETSLRVMSDVSDGKELFLFDISDPGMQFYLGWEGLNLRNPQSLASVLETKDIYILLNKRSLNRLNKKNYKIVSEYPDHILVETKQ